MQCRKTKSIYLSIYEIYIAPLQGNYSEALPAQANEHITLVMRLSNKSNGSFCESYRYKPSSTPKSCYNVPDKGELYCSLE